MNGWEFPFFCFEDGEAFDLGDEPIVPPPRSAKHDAERVQHHLEKAGEHAERLKDPGLTKKIREAQTHVDEKLDPKKGG